MYDCIMIKQVMCVDVYASPRTLHLIFFAITIGKEGANRECYITIDLRIDFYYAYSAL